MFSFPKRCNEAKSRAEKLTNLQLECTLARCSNHSRQAFRNVHPLCLLISWLYFCLQKSLVLTQAISKDTALLGRQRGGCSQRHHYFCWTEDKERKNAETSGSTSKAFGVRSQWAVHRTRNFVFSMDMLSTWSRNETSLDMQALLHCGAKWHLLQKAIPRVFNWFGEIRRMTLKRQQKMRE